MNSIQCYAIVFYILLSYCVLIVPENISLTLFTTVAGISLELVSSSSFGSHSHFCIIKVSEIKWRVSFAGLFQFIIFGES